MNQPIARHLPSHIIRLLVKSRAVALLALEPVDRLGLLINKKGHFPPLWLRRYVGSLARFEASGAEFACLLKLLAGLKSNSALLDIGCGCGMMALELTSYIDGHEGGRYVGTDIHKPSIAWCKHHIKLAHFQFIHHDIYNASFNPKGKIDPADYQFQDTVGYFDVVMAKSLFTHITPSMAEKYLQIIYGKLTKKGTCILSCFLFDSIETSRGTIDFCYGDDHFRYAYKNRIESAVAYQKAYFLSMVDQAGLKLAQPLLRGAWFQPHNAVNFQDIVLLQQK